MVRYKFSKAERQLPKAYRINRWKQIVRHARKDGNFDALLQWNIIQCYFREKFSVEEMTGIFGMSVDEITFEIAIAKQNAY